ncbi:MAG: hypothetical protein ACYDAG_19280, partial [Chloroflexota bacterium]
RVYVSPLSSFEPYVVTDCPIPDEVVVIINTSHPHWSQLKGSDGVANYLRHCTYDAVAEWQAGHLTVPLDPNTVKMLKDRLLRVPFEMEEHGLNDETDAA